MPSTDQPTVKKRKIKNPKQAAEAESGGNVEKKTPKVAGNGARDDIDELFGNLTNAKRMLHKTQAEDAEIEKREKEKGRAAKKLAAEARAEREATGSLASAAVAGQFSEFEYQAPSVHRFTPEGLPVYKYFHLGMKQDDGGTPNCPFDCKCCY
mmetsp:Transcript_67917/g.153689  ORF Transcript_67917/g.153689 Transcript_67917/m.153689 type:complete len:153 (+) Transcript_67917:293-751(+)|eukprot:CAMPEP_0172626948 /NCGR_PEP_ID=MMETSP1068-20121228/153466_1 /TAXON_ID=35684 /ORGANISM="Pseudopedinella elastica, Strain CCMP716" /LENGTH=152 /DNA_ID=CAMNT_0013436701 /DNA_START=213 /DNA_END=671 /DNA_ORIENTATION=+